MFYEMSFIVDRHGVRLSAMWEGSNPHILWRTFVLARTPR